MAPFLAIARTLFDRAASGISLLFRRPRELPVNVLLCVRYVWNIGLSRKHLLVLVREGGLGDLACVLASIPGLRERHPNSWLVLITPQDCRELAVSSGLADAVAEANSFFHRLVERSERRAGYYQPYLPDEHKPPRPQMLHLAEEFAIELGVRADPQCVQFRVPSRVRRRLSRRLHKINPENRPLIVMHPGPTWPVREWPFHRWCELARLIRVHTPAAMIKIGTDLDSMRRKRPLSALPGAVDWTNSLTIMEMVALIEVASVFIGIDSGPLHLAGILGVPSVGLFGPISSDRRIHPGANTVTITGDVACLGCHHQPTGPGHWRTGCPHDMECMRKISAEEVFTRLANLVLIHNLEAAE